MDHLADDADDLMQIVALASGGGSPREGVDETAEIGDLVALGATAPSQRRYEQRSWEHAAHARAAKKQKATETQLAKASARVTELSAQSKINALLGGEPVSKIASSGDLEPDVLSLIAMRLAFGPTVRNNPGKAINQAQAARLVASCLESVQQDPLPKMLLSLTSPKVTGRARRLLVCCHQWDETTQRMQSARAQLLKGEQQHFAPVFRKVLVQQGRLVLESTSPQGVTEIVEQGFLVRSKVLHATSANDILAGLLPSLPFELDRAGSLDHLFQEVEAVVFCWCCDRASSNLCALEWLRREVSAHSPRVLFHAEPCALHGLHLAKSMSPTTSGVAAALSSFSRLLRFASIARDVRKIIIEVVGQNFVWAKEPPSPSQVSYLQRVVEAICGASAAGDNSEANAKSSQTTFRKRLAAFVACCDFSAQGKGCFYHHCEMVAEGHASGNSRDKGCCNNAADALEKTTACVLNFVLGRRWEVAALARWTHVSKLLSRALLLMGGVGLLPRILMALIAAGPSEEEIAARVEEDPTNRQARNQMKLRKVGQALVGKAFEVTVAFWATASLDKLHHAVAGGGQKERVTLQHLINPDVSLVGQCSDALVNLLSDYSQDSDGWSILCYMGVNMRSSEARETGRRVLLQGCAGLFQHFERRMAVPPYSLLRLTSDAVSDLEKARLARQFLAINPACLGSFAAGLRKLFPTERAMVNMAPRYLEAWSDGQDLSIHLSERAHASMRLDIASVGRGKSFTPSSNRVFCRAARAIHMSRGGADPLKTPIVPAALADAPGACGSRPAHGERGTANSHRGGAFIQLHNQKLHAYKQTVAPDRPISSDERKAVLDRARAEWGAVKTVPKLKADWETLKDHPDSRRADETALVKRDQREQPFRPFWGASTSHELVVCPSRVSAHRLVLAGSSGDSDGEDPRLIVPETLPDRCKGVHGSWTAFHGCAGGEKNVCRRHGCLSQQDQRQLDNLVRRLNGFVDQLGKSTVCATNTFLRFRCPRVAAVADLAEGAGERRDLVALLVVARYRPKAQIFCRCEVVGAPPESALPAEYPCRMKLCIGPSRMGGKWRSASLVTTDELCRELLTLGPTWDILPLCTSVDIDSHDLLTFIVHGDRGPFNMSREGRPKPTTSAGPFAWELALSLGDCPTVVGAADASMQVVADPESRESSDDEMEALGLLPPVFLEDVCGVADDESLLEDAECDADPESAGIEAQGGSDAPASSSGEGALDLRVAELVAGASIDEFGYVKPPPGSNVFSQWACVGRITRFEARGPLDKPNVACRCLVHKKCSVVRKAEKFSDADLLRWLLQAEVPRPDATPEEEASAARRHFVLATALL